jgi:amidase
MDLCTTPAVDLARLIRSRELSAAELLAAVLARIDAVNPAVNAIVTLAQEQAASAAAELDSLAARGEFRGPLHGLPIAVKDLAETAGIRTTFGSPIFASYVPSFDAPHVALLKQAGAVVVGKTNTPEFGAGAQTFNRVFGPTRNPFDTRLTPGGSSGGAAAAVATGMVPFADGSDLASSVRNPAAFCGLVGLRTTPGLIPDEAFESLSVIGPLARSAQDAALLLAGMCGRDPGLPLARPDRPADFLDLRPASIKPTLAWNIGKGLALTGEQIAAARAGRAAIFGRVRSFLADGSFAVLALPTVQVVPFPVETEWVAEINGEPMVTYIDWMRSCSRITVSAHPAISVPAGLTADGLPVGLQLVGRYGGDRRLLELAAGIMALDGR